jgi:two-component system nitrate/nitrite sensor histidine kinase NarX
VPAGNRAALFVSDAGRQTLLNVNLIRNRPECRGCHGAQHDILGLLMVEAPLGHLQEQLTSGLRYTLLLAAATFLFLVGAIVPVLRRSILKPIEELSQGVAEISGGNLDYRVPVAGPDELAMLAERFDAMRCALKASYTDMQRRNQELALLNEVAVASSQLLDVQEILDFTLDTVVNRLQMQAGAIYLLDQEAERTSRRACACAFDPECQGAAASDAGGSSRLRAPQCQALGCQGHWPALDLTAPADPASDPLFLANADAGRRAGAWWDERRGHAYVNVPLRCKGKVVGTMALITHSGQSLKRRDLDVLRAVGHEIGIAVNNAQLYRQVRHLAVLEERDRLAREMHDNLAQALGYLNLKASLTQELVAGGDISQAEASLAELKDVAKETYTDVREAIFSLRTPAAASAGLVATLEEYLTEYRAHYGIDARLQTDGAPTGQFGPEVTLQLLRVIQEALSNVRKHAAARRAWVRFEQRAEALSVTIADDGCGFDPRDASATGRGHFGLDIMRERTEIAGGSLNVYSQPGRGTRVVIEMPRDYDARD